MLGTRLVGIYLHFIGLILKRKSESCSVMSDSLWPNRLCSWKSPGQNTGVGSLSLLQGIFPTQGSNPGLPHCRQILYQLSQSYNLLNSLHNYTAKAVFQNTSKNQKKQTSLIVFCVVSEPHKRLFQETWQCSLFFVHPQWDIFNFSHYSPSRKTCKKLFSGILFLVVCVCIVLNFIEKA